MAPKFPDGKLRRVPTIDLNADLGEGCGSDEELFHLVSSASISCGAHAGDARSMRVAIERALAAGVSIGAHPGYPDRAAFGRKETGASPTDIEDIVLAQVELFTAACAKLGAVIRHVKPHGALYNRAMVDRAAADAIARAMVAVDPSLHVLCMPGSEMQASAELAGLPVVTEAFLDRAYATRISLVPRGQSGAMIQDPSVAAFRAERMVIDRSLTLVDGSCGPLTCDSLCVHGDNPAAVALVRAVRARLEAAGVGVSAFPPA